MGAQMLAGGAVPARPADALTAASARADRWLAWGRRVERPMPLGPVPRTRQ
ncbi:hypothetical protein ACIBO5_41310 [Nonomuraea angiospora]|uniref:hypothetical protein n=1 Tax=Nonomuraea angiospora TaxID=46172 RepID=UPI0037B36673